MDRIYWHKQTAGQPLFPDLLWSRPENKSLAGKLLIIGGNLHGFAAPAEAYANALKAGIGVAHVLLPDSLRKTMGKVLENCDFAPSTPSGSFGQKALDEWLASSHWANAVLIAGDLGRNSETAILLEKFLTKYPELVTLTKDAVDYVTTNPQPLLTRTNTTLVLSFAQLQKLASALKYPQALTFDMPLTRLVELLSDFSQSYPLNIITKHLDQIIVAVDGQVSTTKQDSDPEIWRVGAAAKASVWWLQNPIKTFEALTASLCEKLDR